MGTKVQFESCFPGYFSMRDLNEDSNSCSWPLYYGDKTVTNGQYYNGFLPRTIGDVYSGYDKDVVKRTMLEHEAIFKNQLCELHRLYRIQRDLMDEAKRKELNKNRMPVETSLSSSPLASQITSEDARKWHIPGFPLGNSVCAGPSISGIEDMHSPLSSMKGSSVQASPFLSQNAGTSKDVEVLESRPTKVRRKMFDLHLPADEYIDTEVGEQLMDGNLCSISSYVPDINSNRIVARESGMDLLIGGGGKDNCQGDALRTESCLKSKNNLADLNVPVDAEDTNTSSNYHLGCTSHYEIKEFDLAAKTKSDFLGFPQQVLVNSHKDRSNEVLNDPYWSNNDSRRSWFPHMPDSGHCKNNLTSVTEDLQLEKMFSSSQAIQVLSNKNNEPVTLFLDNQSKADQSRERIVHGSQHAERKKESSANSHPISVLTSNIPSQYAVDPSSDLNKSWSHSISSWEKLNGSLNQKSMSVQVHPSLNSSATLSRSSQSSTQSHGIFGDRWNYNTNSTANLRTQSDVPDKNGFYHGSSSGSKELLIRFPSSNYDYLNCSSASNAASEYFMNQNSEKLYKSPNCMELKPGKEVNLNIVHTSSSSTKMASQKCLEVIDLERNHDDDVIALPWLQAKPNCKIDSTYAGVDLNAGGFVDRQSSLNVLSDTSEAGKMPNLLVHQNKKPASLADGVDVSRIGTSDSSSCKKILGFPIFEKSHISKIEPSCLTSPSGFHPQPLEVVENNRKNRVLDINLPCDQAIADFGSQTAAEVPLLEKETDTQVACVRHRIDLNFCATEDEACLTPSVTGSNVKVILGIDLEAPAVPEDEEDIVQVQECSEKADAAAVCLQSTEKTIDSEPDECIRIAAEAIVAISSSVRDNHQDHATYHPSEASMSDPLHWFVDLVSSFGEDLENKYAALGAENCQNNVLSSSEDYFELMTLRLKETNEEDYMPKPLVPENLVLEEVGTPLLTTRTRRGHARRGRQRRDFQRDILPGLTSLSRHEVTEDLQAFGGMMRATGQLWHAGLTRRNSTRNGCGRGRRRSLTNASAAATESPPPPPPPPPLVQQLNNVEVGLEDRNLTGWGKTTRRPRRQRCPPGNPPALPFT